MSASVPQTSSNQNLYSLVERPFLSGFLPKAHDALAKTNKELMSGLGQYIVLLKLAERAFSSFLDHKYDCFDALAKENACQIRAVKVAVIAQNKDSNEFGTTLSTHIRVLIDKVSAIVSAIEGSNQKEVTRWMGKGSAPNLAQLLAQKDWEVELRSKDLQFLILAFGLTWIKETGEANSEGEYEDTSVPGRWSDFSSQAPNFIALNPILVPSKTFYTSMEKHFLDLLTLQSTDYLIENRELLPENDRRFISEEYVAIRKGGYIRSLPMFWSYQLLLEIAKQKALPLVVKVDVYISTEESLPVAPSLIDPFTPDTPTSPQQPFRLAREKHKVLFFEVRNGVYIRLEPSEADFYKPVVVVGGCTWTYSAHLETVVDKIVEVGPCSLILANAAVHKQYVDEENDKKLDSPPDSPPDSPTSTRDELIIKANLWGCSKENKSLFFVKHVYASTLGRCRG